MDQKIVHCWAKSGDVFAHSTTPLNALFYLMAVLAEDGDANGDKFVFPDELVVHYEFENTYTRPVHRTHGKSVTLTWDQAKWRALYRKHKQENEQEIEV